MKALLALRRHHPRGFLYLVRALIITYAFIAWTRDTSAQPSPTSTSHIEILRRQIESATDKHAPPEQLGALWLQLAKEYRGRFDLPPAEDAFAHSLSLLRSPATQIAYADSLNGFGWFYLATERPEKAMNCLRKALKIYHALDDQTRAAKVHETIAETLLSEGRYRDGEAESSEGLKELQSQMQRNPVEISAALLVQSYALCFQGRCTAALNDVNLAMTLVQAVFPPNSLEAAQVWLARGFDQWKSGSPDEGERSMSEAVQILRSLTNEPPQLLAMRNLRPLRLYAACLKANHHKAEASQINSEILQLQLEQYSACNSCTVSAAALAAKP